MSMQGPHAQARNELSRVDYFLDQLARGVESGEVPLASYEAMAPRYLARRAELVAILTGAESPRFVTGEPVSSGRGVPQASTASEMRPAVPRPAVVARPHREPVRWTTVLLFLGAFLVIVASAIFAVAVWQLMSPLVKLGFMASLTVGFYAAGNYAHEKLGMRAGSVALTSVASAMLLFDCWIVIDGFNLQSIPAWTAALFVCSLVYWYTELRYGERFYGVAGAAAQVGWWWLLGAGLHLGYPVRMAGIAVIALVWQLTAERVRAGSAFTSLASVLKWAAPVVGLASLIGLLGDTVNIGSPDTVALLANATAAAVVGVIFWRTELLPSGRAYIAAAAQVPLLVATLMTTQHADWVLAVILLLMAAAFTVVSLLAAGAPFAFLALASEFVFAGVVCDLLGAEPFVITVVYAALAVTWVLASRLTAASPHRRGLAPAWSQLSRKGEFSIVSLVGGEVLLVLASALAIEAGGGVALSGTTISANAAITCAAVLAAWALAALIDRGPRLATGASLWSLYTLAAVLAWSVPGLHSGVYAAALLSLCAVWCFARGAMARFYGVNPNLFGWLYRILAALVVVGGLLAQLFWFASEPVWAGAALALAASLFFTVDALANGPRVSAAMAGGLGTAAAFLAGHAYADMHTPETGALAVLASDPATFAAVAAAAGAAVLSSIGASLSRRLPVFAGLFAVSAVATGTVSLVFAIEEPSRLAFVLVLLTCGWVATAIAMRAQALMALAGFTAFGASIAFVAVGGMSPWVTVGVATVACVVLNLPAFSRAAGPGGRFAVVGQALAVAGVLGATAVAVLGAPLAFIAGLAQPVQWLAFGQHGVAVLLAVVGVSVTAQAIRWKFEPGLYVGLGVLLLALFAEMHALSFTSAEMYSTPLAAYLVGMGYLYAWRVPGRGVPAPLDAAAVLVGLGVPLAGALTMSGQDAFVHTAWAIMLSLLFIAGGIAGRCRIYLFGGAAALALVAGWRTVTYLAEFWWLTLGLIGTAMLVIALTWERQRMMLSETQQRLRDSFENWR